LVARLFKVTRLDTVLPVYPTVVAACEAFTITDHERVDQRINIQLHSSFEPKPSPTTEMPGYRRTGMPM
jgi:hypothetical protein